MKKIVVVGSINMDYVTHVQQQPGVGETVSGQGLDLKPVERGQIRLMRQHIWGQMSQCLEQLAMTRQAV